MVDKEIQIDFPSPPPAIRIVRNSTYGIRDAIAGISVEKAPVETQKVCEKLYGHKYELKRSTEQLD